MREKPRAVVLLTAFFGGRAAYPSVRPTLLTERLRRRPASRQRSKGLPGSNGGSPPSNGRGRILRP
jgi:hypothetical protein